MSPLQDPAFWIKLPSASALQRAFACPESFALPQVEEEPNIYGEAGSTLHDFLRAIGKGATREEALAEVPHDDPGRQACEDVDVEKVPRGGHHELALAWDPETGVGRPLGENIGRAYEEHGAERRREFVGSLDYGGVLPEKRVLVLDYKSGWHLTPAKESWQLRSLSVFKAAAAGAEEAIAGHLVMRGTSIRWDIVEWDGMALAAFRAELRDLAARLRALKPITDLDKANVAEGEHCRYCPAFMRCPAKVGLVRELGRFIAPEADDEAQLVAMTRENAAGAWRKLDAFESIAKRLRGQIEKLARQEPIDLGDGFELCLSAGDGKEAVVDAPIAIKLLREHYDEQTALLAVTSSKTAIGEAVKDYARRMKQKVGATEDAALELLRGAGAIAKKPGEVKVREVRKQIA